MRIDDLYFSELLRQHASSLDLEALCPVGPWEYGQSIRRAKGDCFFFDLSLKNFYPLGLNHPLMLRPTISDPAPKSFSEALKARLPGLESRKWVVLSENAYLRYKPNANEIKRKSFIIDSIWGLKELEVDSADTFSVWLSDASVWVCSKDELPSSDILIHHNWMNLFFNPDVLGPEGRLVEVQKKIMTTFEVTSLDGLSLKLSGSSLALSLLGLLVESVSDSEYMLHFPVSVLFSDIEKVHQMIKSKDFLC